MDFEACIIEEDVESSLLSAARMLDKLLRSSQIRHLFLSLAQTCFERLTAGQCTADIEQVKSLVPLFLSNKNLHKGAHTLTNYICIEPV